MNSPLTVKTAQNAQTSATAASMLPLHKSALWQEIKTQLYRERPMSVSAAMAARRHILGMTHPSANNRVHALKVMAKPSKYSANELQLAQQVLDKTQHQDRFAHKLVQTPLNVASTLAHMPFKAASACTLGLGGAAIAAISGGNVGKGYLYCVEIPAHLLTKAVTIPVSLAAVAIAAPIDLITYDERGSTTKSALKDIVADVKATPSLFKLMASSV